MRAIVAQAAGPAAPLLPPAVADLLANGGILGLASLVIWVMFRHYEGRIKELTDQFTAALEKRDRLADEAAKATSARFEAIIGELREDGRRRDDADRRRDEQWVVINKEMVAALEHVSRSTDDARAGMAELKAGQAATVAGLGEVKAAVTDLGRRVDGLERRDDRR